MQDRRQLAQRVSATELTILSTLTIWFVCVALPTPHAHGAQYDLLGGPGYFEWDGNGDGIADGWTLDRSGGVQPKAALAKPGMPSGGFAQSLEMGSLEGQSGMLKLGTPIRAGPIGVAQPGDTLRIGTYVWAALSKGAYVQGTIKFHAEDWHVIAEPAILPEIKATTFSGNGRLGWRHYTAAVVVPPGCTYMTVEFRLGLPLGLGYGKVQLDSVTVTKETNHAPSPVPGSVQVGLFGDPGPDPTYVARRYGMEIMSEWGWNFVGTYRLYRPEAPLLLYAIAGAVADHNGHSDHVSDRLDFNWVLRHHPDWLLLDVRAQPIRFDGGTYLALDPGNPEYQAVFAEEVIRRAGEMGLDGVMIDNVHTHWEWICSTRSIRYPDNASYGAAVDAFVRAVVPRIKKAGLLVVGNGAHIRWDQGIWSEWMGLFDGRMYEPPASPAPRYETEEEWQGILASYRAMPDRPYIHFLVEPHYDLNMFRFSLASFMMFARRNSFAGLCGRYLVGPPYDPLLNVPFGQPIEECARVGQTAYKRAHQNGVVFLNISSTNSETVSVPATFRDAVTGVTVKPGLRTLGPHESLFLIK